MLADMHVHTTFSLDSSTRMESMVEQAISMGMDMICITDHIDWDFPEKDLIFDFDVKEYQKAIERMQKKYAGRLEIRMGVELGMQPHLSSSYEKLLAQYPFDFVLGSLHLLRNRDPYYKEAFQDLSDQEAYKEYFDDTLVNVQKFHGFDALAHLDYIVRYGREKEKNYNISDYMDVIDEILKELIYNGKALEVNSAGLRKGLGFPNPHVAVIKRYRELGGEMVTVGADAHKPPHMGYGFKEVESILLDSGFKYYVRFKQRKPEFKRI